MVNTFCVSGFLYHPPSQKILLQKENVSSPQSSSWFLLGGMCQEKETPEIVLKNIIVELLGVRISLIIPVYSYENFEKGNNQYIGYALSKSKPNFDDRKGASFGWFSFKDVLKLQITEQTKHDIVVGQRVIEAAERKRLGQHTLL